MWKEKVGRVVGHRGAKGLAPENTIPSLVKAQSIGVQAVEVDCQITADRQLAIIHDDTIDRTTNGIGEVATMTLHQLQQLDAGSWFNEAFIDVRIPDLGDIISFAIRYDVAVNLELKPSDKNQLRLVEKVIEALTSTKETFQPLVSSFDEKTLRLFAETSEGEYPTALLMEVWHNDWLMRTRVINPIAIHIEDMIATQEHIDIIKSEGYLVGVYTVNDEERFDSLISMGADYVFTDFPDRLL